MKTLSFKICNNLMIFSQAILAISVLFSPSTLLANDEVQGGENSKTFHLLEETQNLMAQSSCENWWNSFQINPYLIKSGHLVLESSSCESVRKRFLGFLETLPDSKLYVIKSYYSQPECASISRLAKRWKISRDKAYIVKTQAINDVIETLTDLSSKMRG